MSGVGGVREPCWRCTVVCAARASLRGGVRHDGSGSYLRRRRATARIALDRRGSATPRMPIALMGKVYCKADVALSPINIGDLLTTSKTRGHATKASDSSRAFRSVIGKALGSLAEGQGLIPVLVALKAVPMESKDLMVKERINDKPRSGFFYNLKSCLKLGCCACTASARRPWPPS